MKYGESFTALVNVKTSISNLIPYAFANNEVTINRSS